MTSSLRRTALFSIVFALLAAYLFFLADSRFHAVDKRIYTYYTTSLVEDLDLNVVNQIPAKEAWLLTETHQYPDVHSNGIAVLWAPFFLAAKAVAALSRPASTGADLATLYRSAQTIANVFWGLLAIPLVWRLLRRRFDSRVAATTLAILGLATPFIWYLVYQPENADITSLFLSAALLNLYDERERFRPLAFAGFFGASVVACAAVKFDMIFYGLLAAHLAWERRHSLRAAGSTLLCAAAGSTIAAIPLLANEALKAGFADHAYLDTATSQVYVLFENLFAPSGYFVVEPFWPVLLIVFLALARRRRPDALLLFALAVPLTELALESFNYDHNESFGARHWINDLPCFALVLGQTLLWLERRRTARHAFLAACALAALVSAAAALVYRLDFDAYYFTYLFSPRWLRAFAKAPLSDYAFLARPSDAPIKAALLIPIALAIFTLLQAGRSLARLREPRVLAAMFAALAGLYTAVTVANFANGPASAAAVPDRVAKAVIGAGPHIQSFFENAGCLQRAVEYYRSRGDRATAQRRKQLLDDYVRKAAREITHDPAGFKASLSSEHETYVPAELWDD